jgi:4-hydroxybenzoate polyprenyltransferase
MPLAMPLALLRSLRPHQWAKNTFVLAPLVFAQRLTDGASLVASGRAFLAFCLAASAVYLVNDLRDREEDRRHPSKRLRPIASGALPVGAAFGAIVALIAGTALAAHGLGGAFAGFLAAYAGLNLAYSFGLKTIVILDVLCLGLGFVLRVLAGAAAIDVKVSSWLLLCTTFLSLFLGFSKRRHEIQLLAEGATAQRRVLSHYSAAFLDQMINVVTASAVVCYALYAVSPETVERFHTEHLVYTVPFVLFGIFRYLYLVYQRPEAKNPTEALLFDGPFLVNLLLWAAAVVWIVYGFRVTS